MRLSVALPGYEPKDITVTAAPGEIIVKACRRMEKSDKSRSSATCVHWSEFRSEDVYRRVELPQRIDAVQCVARYDNGMLIVEAPRIEEKAQPVSAPIVTAVKAA